MTTNCYYNNELCHGDTETCKGCSEQFCKTHALTDSLCVVCQSGTELTAETTWPKSLQDHEREFNERRKRVRA